MKKIIKQNANILFVCLFELVVGILLLINPDAFTSAVIVIAGIVLMAAGLYSSVKYFKVEAAEAARGQLLMIGLMLLLAGAFCVFRSSWFIETLPILTVIYGTVILSVGFCKVQISVDRVRLHNAKWYLFAIGALLSVACALVVFFNPFGDADLDKLWIFTGIALTVLALFDILSQILTNYDIKLNKTEPKGIKEELEEKKEPEALPEGK